MYRVIARSPLDGTYTVDLRSAVLKASWRDKVVLAGIEPVS